MYSATAPAIPTATPPPIPHEVEECCGVLRVHSDGSIWRTNKPSFEMAVQDDRPVLWKDVVFDSAQGSTSRLHLSLPSSQFSTTFTVVTFASAPE